MTDLSEFYADSPLRASIVKKRQAEQAKLDKINAKAAPIIITIEMYDDMIATIDRRSKALAALPADENPAPDDQAKDTSTITDEGSTNGASGTALPIEE